MIKRTKYPRTQQLPWSPGATKDDKIMTSKDVSRLTSLEVVVTTKLDGENTTMYRDGLHARSISSANHPSRDWVKAFHARIAWNIPDNLRICGENMYAQHSIPYENLETYFYVFNIWDTSNDENIMLSWDDTKYWAEQIGLTLVPVLYRGTYDRDKIHSVWEETCKDHVSEGYVIRPSQQVDMLYFSRTVAKYVRANHVQTSSHWMSKSVIPNKLKK